MACDICKSDNQVRYYGNLYTSGSEGTYLCQNCQIVACNFLRGMMNIAGEIRKQSYKDKEAGI